jgi:hypothetical protein
MVPAAIIQRIGVVHCVMLSATPPALMATMHRGDEQPSRARHEIRWRKQPRPWDLSGAADPKTRGDRALFFQRRGEGRVVEDVTTDYPYTRRRFE